MRKEYEIEYLIDFEVEYFSLNKLNRFTINDNAIIAERKRSITSDEWTVWWVKQLKEPKLVIEDGYFYYSDTMMVVTAEFIKKLEEYYTYNKRKVILEEIGI